MSEIIRSDWRKTAAAAAAPASWFSDGFIARRWKELTLRKKKEEGEKKLFRYWSKVWLAKAVVEMEGYVCIKVNTKLVPTKTIGSYTVLTNEYDTKKKQHVLLRRDVFIDWLL